MSPSRHWHRCSRGLTASLVLALISAGCGGEDPSETTGAGGGTTTSSQGATTDTGPTTTSSTTSSGCFPELPSVPHTGDLAVYHINFGELGPDGCLDPSLSGWKHVGVDLDGQDGPDGMNCTPQADAFPGALEDGEGGIDNAFSHFAIPIASNYIQLSDQSNAGFREGSATLAFSAEGLDQIQAGDGVLLSIFVTAPLPPPAEGKNELKLDGTDVLPADATWLTGGAPSLTAQASFDGTQLEATLDMLPVPLSVALGDARYLLYVKVHEARLVLPLDAARTRVVRGAIAGYLDHLEVFDAIQTVMGSYIQELCTNGTVLNLEQQLRQAQDIHTDGLFDAECNAISFGVQFDAVSVDVEGEILVPPPENPCAAM